LKNYKLKIKTNEPVNQKKQHLRFHILPEAHKPANALISVGVNFLEMLTQTLSDKEARNNLVASLTEKDEKTGKTYVKIPVENEKIVENAVNLLSGFLKVFQNKNQ
jgi:hypothetical protein